MRTSTLFLLGLLPFGWLLALALVGPSDAPAPPAEPRRVVTLAPSLTEMVFHVGAGDRLVGRSDYCEYPPEVATRPSVGGYYDPRLEDILRLEPDVVLCVATQTWLLDRCRDLGLPAVGVDVRSVEGIVEGIREVGRVLGVPEAGEARAAELAAALAARTRPHGPDPERVLWLHYRDQGTLKGMIGLAPGGHTHELLERTGRVNVLAESGSEAPQLSAELILLMRPDVIVDDATYLGADPEHLAAQREVWAELLGHPSLADTRLVFLTENTPYLPGPRIAEGLRVMTDLLDG